MDVFNTRNYIFNKIFLVVIGTWPYQSPFKNILDTFLFCFASTNLTYTCLFLVCIVLYLDKHIDSRNNYVHFKIPVIRETWGDLRQTTELLAPLLTLIIVLTKIVNSFVNHDKFKELLDRIKRDYEAFDDDSEMEIQTRYADRARKITIAYTIWCYSSYILYIFGSYLQHTEGRIFPGHAKYYIDKEKYYWFIVIHQSLSIATLCHTIVAFDTFYVVLIHHTCCKFELLGYHLKRITDNTVDYMSAEDESKMYKEIVVCIKRHKDAIGFANLLESVFTVLSFVNLTMNMVVLSTAGFAILSNLDTPGNAVKFAGLLLGLTIHLFLMSWPAQEMMDCSIQVSEYSYFSLWYRTSPRIQKLLRLMMMRSIIPCKLTAGKFFVMSLSSFCAILKTSMSYFTLLKSIQE